jgi:hypothetical protein
VTDALLIVLFAGVSEAIGQSVVLFANRVSPARFVVSLLMNAFLVAAGFAALVLCTWASFLLPDTRAVTLPVLTVAIALSYTPLMAGFLAALPYAGNAVMWALRVGQLVVMVTGVASAAHVALTLAAAHVAAGWGVKLGLRHVFGKQFARLQSGLMNAAAGTTLVAEKAAVRSVARQIIGTPDAVVTTAHKAPRVATRIAVPLFAGVIATFVAVVAILIALTPLRITIPHAFAGVVFLRLGADIIWVAIAAVVIAAFLAPLETLGWWAGWYGETVDQEQHSPASATGAASPAQPARYIVYLDGISQSSAAYTPDVETFLDALQRELPAGMVLIRGIMAYSVLNRPLDVDPMYARFWSWVERLRGRTRTAILGMFINIRNVMIVAVSADARYGPLYNLGIAQVIYNQLVERGYRVQSRVPITMIGYSGGGQMCAETGALLKRALGAPLEIISLAGVMAGTCPFLAIDHLHHMFGSKDIIEPLGPIMFSSRWKIMRHSNWNRACNRGKVTIAHLGPVGHQVPGGLLDPSYTLPDGRSALRQTLDRIHAIIARSNPAVTP